MSSMKRKRKVVTIERKLETIDQLAIGVRVSFLAVRNNMSIVIRKNRLSNPPLVLISSDNRHSAVFSNGVQNYVKQFFVLVFLYNV